MIGGSRTHYVRAILAGFLVLLVAVALVDVGMVSYQRRLMTAEAFRHLDEQLALLNTLLREPLLQRRYGAVESFLLDWGEEHDSITVLRAVAANGFVLAEYQRPEPAERPLRASKGLVYGSQGRLVVEVERDIVDLERSLTRLSRRLLSGSAIMLAVLAVALWSILYNAALRPLEQEIDRRRLAEEKLENSRHWLQVQVGERTADLRQANERLRAEVEDRRKAEAAVKKSEEQNRMLLESAAEAIYGVDKEGICTFCNPACLRLLGWPEEADLKGKRIHDVIHHSRADGSPYPHQECRIYDSYRNGEEVHIEQEVMWRADGSSFPVDAWSHPIRRKGEIVGAVVTFLDISKRLEAEEQRRSLEEQVRHAQKLESLGVLAGGIAHDFNNLLMGVLGNAELALADLEADSACRDYLERIETTAKRAADLTSQMLAYAGKGRLAMEPVDLNRLVTELGHLLETVISKKAAIQFELAPSLPPIHADSSQVRQVVMNLITNASEAIGDNPGTIRIATRLEPAERLGFPAPASDGSERGDSFVSLVIADDGAGMDSQTRQRIFDPFFTTKFAGRGLGLAAVMGIVSGHGATIDVESEPGRGTTFTVLFPTAAAPMASRSPTSERFTSEVDRGISVLVVDDDPGVLLVAKAILLNAGYQVLTAGDGVEGVETFDRHKDELALVLLDMTMPRMDGEEAYRELRRIRPDVKVVLSSGYTELEAAARFVEGELAGFIQKPYRSAELLSRVATALDPSAL